MVFITLDSLDLVQRIEVQNASPLPLTPNHEIVEGNLTWLRFRETGGEQPHNSGRHAHNQHEPDNLA